MMQTERERPLRPPPPGSTQGAASRTSHHFDSVNALQSRIQKLHDESYLYIEQGLSCDEQGHADQAVTLYNKGLDLTNKGLAVVSDNAKNMIGAEWQKTNTLVSKMKKTKTQIERRVKVLMESDPLVIRSITDPPPDYEESLNEHMLADENNPSNESLTANASELFSIVEGVQIFFINENGGVSAPSYPSSLGIYKFMDSVNENKPPAFLQIGNWTYPLIPGHSPALHSTWGAYVFPDTNVPGSSVGVIIPDNVSRQKKKKLENLLCELTQLRTQDAGNLDDFIFPKIPDEIPGEQRGSLTHSETEDNTSTKVAKGIVTAAEWISWGLTKGAEKTGSLMKKGSSYIQERVKPEEQVSQIDPRAQQGVYYARQATGAAVKVSGFIVTKLGEGTAALARMAAPHLRAQGEKLLPKSMTTKGEGGSSKVDDLSVVAVGGLKGWATVFVGLEQAARALATSLTMETVTVVRHKYGSDAAEFTENGMFAAGNLGVAAYNFNNLGVKAIAKRAAKDTGKAVVDDYANRPKVIKQQEEAGACGFSQANQNISYKK